MMGAALRICRPNSESPMPPDLPIDYLLVLPAAANTCIGSTRIRASRASPERGNGAVFSSSPSHLTRDYHVRLTAPSSALPTK